MKTARSTHTAWREIDGETYVINLRSKTLFGLNSEAGRVWHHLGEEKDAAAIASAICNENDGRVRPDELEPVIAGFLAELVDRGLADYDDSCIDQSVRAAAKCSHFAPQVAWSERLSAAGYSCAHKPGQSATCAQVPRT